jgi:hypothetical protein
MANPTLFQLATTTVGSGGVSSVTFSAIPQVYTDLVIKASVRTTWSGAADNLLISFNGSSTSFSGKLLYGTGSAASSTSMTDNSNTLLTDGATATASTFGNGEFYIPNYTSGNYKSISSDSVNETNATAAYQYLYAGLWSNTSAITSIGFTSQNSSNFVQYSTFTLYGVRNY